MKHLTTQTYILASSQHSHKDKMNSGRRLWRTNTQNLNVYMHAPNRCIQPHKRKLLFVSKLRHMTINSDLFGQSSFFNRPFKDWMWQKLTAKTIMEKIYSNGFKRYNHGICYNKHHDGDTEACIVFVFHNFPFIFTYYLYPQTIKQLFKKLKIVIMTRFFWLN